MNFIVKKHLDQIISNTCEVPRDIQVYIIYQLNFAVFDMTPWDLNLRVPGLIYVTLEDLNLEW
jgi:hypothetical protein